MSSIRLFGAEWHVGPEDFFLPACYASCINVPLLVVTALAYSALLDEPSCSSADDHSLEVYKLGSMVLYAIATVVDCLVMERSSKTRLFHHNPLLSALLYVRMAVMAALAVFCVLGSAWYAQLDDGCLDRNPRLRSMYLAILGCSWVSVTSTLCWVCIFYKSTSSASGSGEVDHQRREESWAWRLRCLSWMTCSPNRNGDMFTTIARHLATIFAAKGLVASDVFVGLMLVKAMQVGETRAGKKRFYVTDPDALAEYHRSKNAPPPVKGSKIAENDGDAAFMAMHTDLDADDEKSARDVRIDIPAPSPALSDASFSTPQSLSADDPIARLASQGIQPELPEAHWIRIESARYYSRFALGSYGWPLFTLMDPCACLTGRLCGCCMNFPNGPHQSANGVPCCSCNIKAFVLRSKIDEDDLLYANLHNEFGSVVYYVAHDRVRKALVIAIRGTMSLEDALTDLDAGVTALDDDGYAGHHTHAGILRAVRELRADLKRRRILETFFEQHPGHQLVITGHSLGAGASAILALLLSKDYPDLHCYAFAPPLVFDRGLATKPELKRLITSVVYNKDLVPRLSVHAINVLQKQIEVAFMRNQSATKYEIMARSHRREYSHMVTLDDEKIDREDAINASKIAQRLPISSKSKGDSRNHMQYDSVLDTTPRKSEEEAAAEAHAAQTHTDESDEKATTTTTTEQRQRRNVHGDARQTNAFRRLASLGDQRRRRLTIRAPERQEDWHQLHTPGMIYHIVRHRDALPHGRSSSLCCSSRAEQITVYPAAESAFNEIMVDSSMGLDHMPDVYFRRLHELRIPRAVDEGQQHLHHQSQLN
eukprot:TRINITY_DN61115_c0_g1_i1.p1 TRINITY_DN61115_c0_g1~~TRINITY_DN61115_c0_g1_i1.p1  ORF type:complete len:824 (+),score=375.68 TRINITY_DN61115_c0_g1_i1:14-2485(+)